MYNQIIALILLSTLSNAQLNGWTDCGTTLATIHELRVTGCTQTPCTFVRGQSYDIELDATSLTNSSTLPYKVTASVIIPILLLHGNACDNLSVGHCPAVVGNRFTFKTTYAPPTSLPTISTVVTSTVSNDSGIVGICIKFNVSLVQSRANNTLGLIN